MVVHAVHGTWPYGLWTQMLSRKAPKLESGSLPWFIEGSGFHEYIKQNSRRAIIWIPFNWTGANSFGARHEGARSFSKHLALWLQKEAESEHVIIAHSHGGSVTIEALRMMNQNELASLSKVITLATPFAEAKPSDRDIRELVGRYLALRFGLVPIVMFAFAVTLMMTATGTFYDRLTGVFVIYLVMMLVSLAFLFLLWRLKVVRFKAPKLPTQRPAVIQAWMLYAVRAARDEASIAINSSQFIDIASDVLFRRLMLFPFDYAHGVLVKPLWKDRIYVYVAIGFLSFVLVQLLIRPGHRDSIETMMNDFLPSLLGSVFSAPLLVVYFIAISFAMIALLAPLILIPATLIVAVALGWDVIHYLGLMQIECEPIPSGVTGIVSTVRVTSEEQRNLGMVHYIHATEAARRRVVEIISSPSGSVSPNYRGYHRQPRAGENTLDRGA